MESEPRRDRSEARPDTPTEEGPGETTASLERALADLGEELSRVAEELALQSRVGVDRVRAGMRRGAYAGVLLAVALVGLVTWVVTGTWFVASGLTTSLREGLGLGGGAGQLAGGLVILTLAAGGLWACWRVGDRRRLRRARRRYGDEGPA